jgi:hypothetical protein
MFFPIVGLRIVGTLGQPEPVKPDEKFMRGRGPKLVGGPTDRGGRNS